MRSPSTAPVDRPPVIAVNATPCPPWQDISTLCANICACVTTVETWVKLGILPPPRLKGGKRMWKWAEVDAYLSRDDAKREDSDADRIREATRRAAAETA